VKSDCRGTTTEVQTADIPPETERQLVDRLRRRDESAFAELMDLHSPWMLRAAALYVKNRATAEEVVQEAWLNVVRGIHDFEGRSTIRTWLYAIVSNAAKRRAVRESHWVPDPAISAGRGPDRGTDPTAAWFFDKEHGRWGGCWTSTVQPWGSIPDDSLEAAELRECIEDACRSLPDTQRTVFVLRDIQGWTGPEVCNALGLSDSNQRVLLHRARLSIRSALEQQYLGAESTC
jgi:RNA polymerase sigma-70 factor (ECF subfamily)